MNLYLKLPAIALALTLAGCGKPTPKAQEHGDWPANAVVARVTAESLKDALLLSASIEAQYETEVISELNAGVAEILFEEGQQVDYNQPLVRLEEVRTRARLKEAEAGHKLARLTFERNKKLLESESISQQVFDQSEANFYNAEAALLLAWEDQSNTVIRAPFDGQVGERMISPGEILNPGTPITTLIGTEGPELVFNVPEQHIARLTEGLTVNFTSSAYPGETFQGSISYIAPSIDADTRTIRVKALLDEASGKLKPGMFGKLRLVLETRESALLLPESAVWFKGGAKMVVTVSPEGKSGFQPVSTGIRLEGRVEITSGLSNGDMVVIEGYQKMGPGMSVIATPESEAYGITPGPIGQPAAPDETPEAPEEATGEEASHEAG